MGVLIISNSGASAGTIFGHPGKRSGARGRGSGVELASGTWCVVGVKWWLRTTSHLTPTTHRHETHETRTYPARRQSVRARRARGVDGATRAEHPLRAAPGGHARHGDWEDWKSVDGGNLINGCIISNSDAFAGAILDARNCGHCQHFCCWTNGDCNIVRRKKGRRQRVPDVSALGACPKSDQLLPTHRRNPLHGTPMFLLLCRGFVW
jgi:hypothetical protein